jgi:hypothetical protein
MLISGDSVREARPLGYVYWNVNLSAKEVAEVPRAVVTVTSTVPANPNNLAGEMAVMDVAELTVNDVTVVVPNFTAETLIRLVPVMVTLVPPPVGPALGLTPVTVAASW